MFLFSYLQQPPRFSNMYRLLTFAWKFVLTTPFCFFLVWTKPVHSQKRASCITSAAGLLPCCHQADIRMRSHRLLRLDDNRSAASCQQAWCNLIIETLCSQAWCKLFEQLAASLQISSCNKSDFHRLAATWWNWQACCNLLTNLQQAGKIHNLQQVCGVSGCVYVN